MESLPSPKECLEILRKQDVPGHIIAHSVMVANVGLSIARALNAKCNFLLSEETILSACLLHDVKKMECIERGCDHAQEGFRFLKAMNLLEIAHMVRQHYSLDPENKDFTRIKDVHLVYYADNRVKHNEIVSLDERFSDLMVRYGKDKATLVSLKRRLSETKDLERAIFAPLNLDPSDLELLVDEFLSSTQHDPTIQYLTKAWRGRWETRLPFSATRHS